MKSLPKWYDQQIIDVISVIFLPLAIFLCYKAGKSIKGNTLILGIGVLLGLIGVILYQL